ncbi:unnamed protein product [Wickerhamomyces anomalus]
MDFIDYDTFQSTDNSSDNLKNPLPEPAPPLILPINPDFTNRFKNLSLLKKNLPLNQENNNISTSDNDVNITSKTAEKYAKLSIDLLNTNHNQSHDKMISDLPTTTTASNTTDQTSKLNDHLHSNASKSNSSVLSTRLSKILNSYDNNDPNLRDALLILQKKSNLEVEQLIRSDLLGSIARRNFRSEIEGDLLKQHTNVLREFQPVVTKIENIGTKINKLNDINNNLQRFDKLDPELVSKIEELSNSKHLLILKKSLLTNFKKKFTLNQYEEHILTNEDISIEFFKVLNKCKKIHSNCSILLTLGNQNLGLKIMEKMNKFLDLSYQRISFFLENQLLKNLNEENLSNNKNIKLLKISIFHLSDNVRYFDEILSKLIQQRSKTIVDEFLYQLNNADSNDVSRPIVLSAHDPLRYIGDILAYVHSVIVNEVEFIQNLFQKIDSSENDELYNQRSELEEALIHVENFQNVDDIVNDTLVKIINGLSRPLKIRIEQVVRSEKHLDVIPKISNLLDLFKMMYEKILPKKLKDCSVIESLDSLKSLCIEKIFGLLKEKLTIIKNENNSELDDLLLPPDWVRDYLTDALVIFQDSSIGSDSNVFGLSDELFENLSDLIVNKPIEILSEHSKSLADGRNIKIFKLNALDLIQTKIITTTQLSKKCDEVNDLITSLKQELNEHQYELLLKDSDLSIHQQLITLIFPIDQIETDDDYAMYASLIENKLFGKEKLQEIETKLHEFLPVALIETQQSLFKISSPTIANDIITESSLKFLNLYNVFYKILQEIYPEDHLLEWTTYDVTTLLGVEEVYKDSL